MQVVVISINWFDKSNITQKVNVQYLVNIWENAKTLAVLLNQVKGKKHASVKAWELGQIGRQGRWTVSAHVTSMVLVPWVEEGPNSIK